MCTEPTYTSAQQRRRQLELLTLVLSSRRNRGPIIVPLGIAGEFLELACGRLLERLGQRSLRDPVWELKVPLLERSNQDNDVGTELNRSRNGVEGSQRA